MEESIDAVAHPQLAFKRFNMNRAGSRTDRLREDRVYQTDDGRIEGPIQQIIRLFVFGGDRPPSSPARSDLTGSMPETPLRSSTPVAPAPLPVIAPSFA
jgi:hypothetical protein